MGGTSSKACPNDLQLQIEAGRNYQERIKRYNCALHGSYYEYIEWCHGQYKLECIVEKEEIKNRQDSVASR